MGNNMDTQNKPYNAMLRFDSNIMSDFEASIQLNHTKVDQTSFVCAKDGAELFIVGCAKLETPDGLHITGTDIIKLIYTDIKATKVELLAFLQGAENKAFAGYKVINQPWFEWQERHGEVIGEILDEIPSDIAELELVA
jgi:hypothetical protein